ncbi:MAG: Na/Pi symporter, partial [Chromatocurvus sp.]
MLHWTTIANFLGGIGLFLLGMRLMTDGLKVAAGGALRELLKAATGSRLRALLFGAGITALVQSSSAVIFATIGFVNAGLLSLGPAVNLIIGANLGTTLTSWIVALVGFKLDLKLFAMPMIAIGTALWLSGASRRGALGGAIIGFGVFFLGLDVLKDAFSGLDQALDLAAFAGDGILALLMFTGIGVLLTLLMQSSSAALAVTLTAAAQGVISLEAAAGIVVGANIGTTSTAVFSTIGATAAARRTAASHVVFNVIAGVLALLLLPWLIAVAGRSAAPVASAIMRATAISHGKRSS